MLGIAHNPTTRTVYKVALCLRMVALALLGALVLAASAQAAGETPSAGVGSTEASSTPPASEAGSTPPASEAGGSGSATEESGVSNTPLLPGKMPETVSAIPAPEIKAPETVSATPAPEIKAPETVSAIPAPENEIVSVPTEIAPPTVGSEQSTGVPLPEKTESPKTAPGPEKELAGIITSPEKTSEAPPPPPVVEPPVTLTRSDLGYATPEIGYEAAPDVPGALINSPTNPPAGGSLELVASEGAAAAAAVAQISNGQRAGELSCELSSLSGDMAGGCSTEWLAPQRLLSGSPAGYAAAVAALAPTTGSPGDGGHGGSAVGSPPVSPGPGPAPAGASGSSAGASGLALAGFLTLAGLLLLGAPRAMRRLRLSCQPWRTACFVLIPERPG